MNGDAVHVICGCLYLADMEPGAHVDTDRRYGFDNRGRATHRPSGAIESREESIAKRFDLTAAVSSDLGSNDLIVSVQKLVPSVVAQLTGALR